jgi:hypothetical protein
MRFKQFKFAFAALVPLAIACGQQRESPSKSAAASQSSSEPENFPRLAAQAKEVNDAFGRKDFARVADMTYPRLVEILGGRDRMVSSITKEMKQMEAEGVVFLSSSAGAPTQVIHLEGTIYAVLPTILKVKAQDGIFQSDGSMIAISSDRGANWTFIDAGGKDQKQLKSLLPTAADKLNLPPEKPPVRIADGD